MIRLVVLVFTTYTDYISTSDYNYRLYQQVTVLSVNMVIMNSPFSSLIERSATTINDCDILYLIVGFNFMSILLVPILCQPEHNEQKDN